METEQELQEQRIAEQVQLRKDYQDTFSSPHGKRTLENLKKTCHFMSIIDCDEPLILGKWTGERNVIIHILKAIEKDPYDKPQSKAVENPQPVNDQGAD